MLQLTRDGEYAVRAVVYLATRPEGELCLISEIADVQDVPRSYLSKIMQQLVKAGLVKSRRGAKGGFALARPAGEITLREAIEAIEGPINLNICLIRPGECHKDVTCPVHPVWKEAQEKLFEVLDSKTMDELAVEAVELADKACRDAGGGGKKKS